MKTETLLFHRNKWKLIHCNSIALQCVNNYATSFYYLPQRSWSKVIYSEVCVKNSVHRASLQAHTQGGSWGVWPGAVSRPTAMGEVEVSGLWSLQAHTQGHVEGSGQEGRGSPGPHQEGCQGPGPGGVSQGVYALRQTTSPSRRVLLRVVRILLECILV